MIRIYNKAYSLLKKFLRKNNYTPCIVMNLKHDLIHTNDCDLVYIFF